MAVTVNTTVITNSGEGAAVTSGNNGAQIAITSFQIGAGHLNLTRVGPEIQWTWWGRVIIYVADVDATYTQARAGGLEPEFAPRDASWAERYFHIVDPDGHELSFARPL